MYNPVYVSNNFLTRSFNQKTPVTAMKVQKMLYFLYRDYFLKTNLTLFSERFSTWKYGPVLESVYHTYKSYGAKSITEYGGNPAYWIREDEDDTLKKLINRVWEGSKPYTGIYLSQLTHKSEGAWYKAWVKNSPYLLDEDILQDTVLLK